MITDQEANTVYFSDLVLEAPTYAPAFNRLRLILEKHQTVYRFLKGTKDIWCRDYMPIQKDLNDFIQFRYEPAYLREYPELQSEPATVLKANELDVRFSHINLDGGNVIKSSDKVILTTRVFQENPAVARGEIIHTLERLFEAEVCIIPDIKEDMTGHADGHLRFIDNKTVLVNQLASEYQYWRDGFLHMIRQAGLQYVEMPWFEHRDSAHRMSAVGGYVNYLEIGELIILPVFEVKGNLDAHAYDVIASVFPDKLIETVNINEIAYQGGLLNCMSWTIKH